FCGSFKSVARAVVRFEQVFGALEVYVHVVIFFQFLLDVRNDFDLREFVHGLRVIGNRAVGINRDCYRSHAQETKRYQAKGENRGRDHLRAQPLQTDQVAHRHQSDHCKSQVVAGEISRHEAGQNTQRRATLLRGSDHFANVPRFRGGENFYQLRYHSPGKRAAGNNGRQLPPLCRVAAKLGNDYGRYGVGDNDRNNGSDPHQRRERRFEIHFRRVRESRFGNQVVYEISQGAGHQHGDAHYEDPYKQLDLNDWTLHAQQNKGDERDAGDAVSLKTVCGGSHGVPRVVAGAVSDYAWIARVVLFNLEDDFHQIGTDVSN